MFRILVYIDTNCINAKQAVYAINELEKLSEQEKITIEKTDVLDTELQRNQGYPSGQKKSMDYIESFGQYVPDHSRMGFSIEGDASDNQRLSRVLIILWGVKEWSDYSKQEIGDAMHISTAIRSGGTYFITHEKALLSKSENIEGEFRIKVRNPIKCLAEVRDFLQRRDGYNR